jgi:hypothetical protein
MRTHSYEVISGVLFLFLGVMQLLRFLFRWDIIAAGYILPLWPSALICLVLVYMGYQGLKLSRTN